MERAIVHLDVPDYFAAIEENRESAVKRRAVVFAVPGTRSIVQGVNANARKEGIQEGMLLHQAQRRCRGLHIIPPDLATYRKHHENLLKKLSHYSPLVEGAHLGHFFLDLTGTRRLWGPSADAVFSMEKNLFRDDGLPVRAGLAVNKLVSQVAAHVGCSGDLRYIFPGLERSFFHPLPVTALPGVGEKTAKCLSNLNIQFIGDLSGLGAEDICGVLGRGGLRLLQIAQGVDPTPVLPMNHSQKLSFTQDLKRDEIERERIEAAILELSEDAGWQLRSLNRVPGRFSLEVRYADGVTASSDQGLSPAFNRLDLQLFKAVLSTFERLPYRRVAIRRLSLEFSQFQMPIRQMSLFHWDEETSDRRLQDTLDDIRGRFGRRAILWGRSARQEEP